VLTHRAPGPLTGKEPRPVANLSALAPPAAETRDLIFWGVLLGVVLIVGIFLAVAKLVTVLQKRGQNRHCCRHCHEIAWLRDATQALAVKTVQVEAAREQLRLLCDVARDHVAVLAAIRAELEAFRDGWDLIPDTFAGDPGRHGVDTTTNALPAVPSPSGGVKAL
jgi:hypothetical protein